MADLLLELFSEEIPARMQPRACEDLKRLLGKALKDAQLAFAEMQAFATPRRLTVHVTGLPNAQPDVREERRGPRADAPEKAIEGFLKSAGLKRDQLEEREEKKGTFLYAKIEKQGAPAADVLAKIIPPIIRTFPWPKSMRWGAASHTTESLRWVRPLQSILCIFDGAVVPFEIDGITSGDITYGHRFHAPEPFKVSGLEDYTRKLEEAKVILDPIARSNQIIKEANAFALVSQVEIVRDDALVAENAGLNEWPNVLMGSFDESFLNVPDEALTATMRGNQKYFSLRDPKTKKLTNKFLCVANIQAPDGGQAIVAGNEKVLSARLSDAKFFWEQDKKIPLETMAEKLDTITFHEKLGSVGEKVQRVAKLARWLG
ncbi:MAG: glycine--tRNA ligase subunit beta, partial [Pseudomonadota bacterium]